MSSFLAKYARTPRIFSLTLKRSNGNAEYEVFRNNQSVLEVFKTEKEFIIVELSKVKGKLVQHTRDQKR